MMMPDDHHHLSFPSYVLHQEHISSSPNPNPNPTSSNTTKRKRNLPGNPDPDAEVIALSPNSLMATNRFICDVCNKGFKGDQNLQLHRRGHNLPWKLKQRKNKEQVKKKVYICPEKSCGDLTGIKKHFSRKHGEKKWKCDKCYKKYAVISDWKAHSKICGTREYRCDCGTLFSRKDSFITHRAFCDALAEESARFVTIPISETIGNINQNDYKHRLVNPTSSQLDQPGFTNPLPNNVFESSSSSTPSDTLRNLWSLQGKSSIQWLLNKNNNNNNSNILQRGISKNQKDYEVKKETVNGSFFSSASMSATALLQKAAQMGSKISTSSSNNSTAFGLMTSKEVDEKGFTRDFLGVGRQHRPPK